ncbi:MAG: phosphodiester glycosidase family protein [Ruminococcaceae bacterium]|nr:phosphodiester glycosidase family protein [Oscillospiraceae bacterium]
MRNRKNIPLWVLIVGDVLIAGIVLCIFAFFHHVVSEEKPSDGIIVTPPTTNEMENWSEKFAEHFSDELVMTDNTYKSSNISITITEHRNKADTCTYYVADVYISNIKCLQTYLADKKFGDNITQKGLDMFRDSGAVFAMNGDYYGARSSGLCIRNGEVYRSSIIKNQDVCILYYDGTMETFLGEDFDLDYVIDKGAYQGWAFGPSLLDDGGKALTEYPSWYSKIGGVNPRSAIGYYEPGHYCFIAINGRDPGVDEGMTFLEMSELMEELGCKVAYNLDGGISSFMAYNGKYVHKPAPAWGAEAPRAISDCIILKEY